MSTFLSGLENLPFEECVMIAVFAIEVLIAVTYLFYLEWKFCRESRQMDSEFQVWKTHWDEEHPQQKPRLKIYSFEVESDLTHREAA